MSFFLMILGFFLIIVDLNPKTMDLGFVKINMLLVP
jgi:hypothetical protein